MNDGVIMYTWREVSDGMIVEESLAVAGPPTREGAWDD